MICRRSRPPSASSSPAQRQAHTRRLQRQAPAAEAAAPSGPRARHKRATAMGGGAAAHCRCPGPPPAAGVPVPLRPALCWGRCRRPSGSHRLGRRPGRASRVSSGQGPGGGACPAASDTAGARPAPASRQGRQGQARRGRQRPAPAARRTWRRGARLLRRLLVLVTVTAAPAFDRLRRLARELLAQPLWHCRLSGLRGRAAQQGELAGRGGMCHMATSAIGAVQGRRWAWQAARAGAP